MKTRDPYQAPLDRLGRGLSLPTICFRTFLTAFLRSAGILGLRGGFETVLELLKLFPPIAQDCECSTWRIKSWFVHSDAPVERCPVPSFYGLCHSYQTVLYVVVPYKYHHACIRRISPRCSPQVEYQIAVLILCELHRNVAIVVPQVRYRGCQVELS